MSRCGRTTRFSTTVTQLWYQQPVLQDLGSLVAPSFDSAGQNAESIAPLAPLYPPQLLRFCLASPCWCVGRHHSPEL